MEAEFSKQKEESAKQANKVKEMNEELDKKMEVHNAEINARLEKHDKQLDLMQKQIQTNHESSMNSISTLLAKFDQLISNGIPTKPSGPFVSPAGQKIIRKMVGPAAAFNATDILDVTAQEEKISDIYDDYETDSYGQVNALLRAGEQ